MVGTKNLKHEPRKRPLSNLAKCRPLGGYTLSKNTAENFTKVSPFKTPREKAQESTQHPANKDRTVRSKGPDSPVLTGGKTH